jgi:hypothetical protein
VACSYGPALHARFHDFDRSSQAVTHHQMCGVETVEREVGIGRRELPGQSIRDVVVLRVAAQRAVSHSSDGRSAKRWSRLWRRRVCTSISAMFSQLPCFGVQWISSRSAIRLASPGGMPHRARAGNVYCAVIHPQEEPVGRAGAFCNAASSPPSTTLRRTRHRSRQGRPRPGRP